ncbi:MAG: AraC family transcriptional regulator [Mycobacterium sp.]
MSATQRRPSSADLVAELATRARREGANVGLWPGLTFYRFTEATEPRWDDTDSVAIAVVAHGRAAAIAGQRHRYDTFECLVICNRADLDGRIAEASTSQPCLCLVLEVDPQLIRQLAANMPGCDRPIDPVADDGNECVVSALDDELTSSVLRFLRSLSVASDRRVLAPLYLQEMVYRVLQRDRYERLVRVAARHVTASPVAAALDYIAANLADPLTVTELARQANLSPSAFSRLFRKVTGCSPYQFVKEKRLHLARKLLEEGRLGVTDVSRSVGYTSLSHFIKEFRNRFGATPGDYVDSHLLGKGEQALLRSMA